MSKSEGNEKELRVLDFRTSFGQWVSIVVVVIAVSLTPRAFESYVQKGLHSLFPEIFNEIRAPPPPTLEDRIKLLTDSLNSSARTIQEIENEIKDRQALVTKLQRDAEIAQKLTALNKDQVDAIAQVLRGQIEAEEHRSFWGNQFLAVLYTLLGVALAELSRWFLRWRARRKAAAK
jgi:hypothetical protein